MSTSLIVAQVALTSIWSTVAQAAATLNVVFLVALGGLWGRNYLRFRSKHTLGLLVFAVLLAFENLLVVYAYLLDPTLSQWWHDPQLVPVIVWKLQTVVNVLEALGLAFLLWVSWD